MLVGYDTYIIYRVYIKDQKKVIRVKDLCIFENYETKSSIEVLNYDDKPTFQGFFSENNDERSEELASTYVEGQKVENTKENQISETNTCTEDARAAKPTSTIPAHTEHARATNTSTIPACTENVRANPPITTHSNQRSFAHIG